MGHQFFKKDFDLMYYSRNGEVSERFKELVLKTSDSERGRGFESHPLRHVCISSGLEKYSSRFKRTVC